MNLHPHRPKLTARLAAVAKNMDVSFDGELFRFINPRYSKATDIVNGTGALHTAGRWHLSGATRLSYTSLAPHTALAEALAQVNYYHLPLSKALPRVLVALRLKAHRALDLRDGRVRKALRLSETTIRDLDWRAENQNGEEAITQAWGYAWAEADFEVVIVPSAAVPDGANVLIFPENLLPASRFEVVDEVKWPGK